MHTQTYTTKRTALPDSDRAFFYVAGIPTKGIWLDLENVDCWSDVHDALHVAGLIDADYGGDVLVADVEGALPCAAYSSRFAMLDLTAYLELRNDVEHRGFNSEALVAFINWYGSWDADAFESAFMGRYDSEEAFADQYIDDTGTLAGSLTIRL